MAMGTPSPGLPDGWIHRKVKAKPVQIRIDGRAWNGWLTEWARDPYGEWWAWGWGEWVRWDRWIRARYIRPYVPRAQRRDDDDRDDEGGGPG